MTMTALQEPQTATGRQDGEAEPLADALPPGTVLCHGQYRIERYLNSGGFGVTYLATDSLGRKVVVKECYPSLMCCRSGGVVRPRSRGVAPDFERVLTLFQKEAHALAHLSHGCIVGVHQIFREFGTAYMALDYVDGPDLLQVLDSDPAALPPEEIMRLTVHLLEALAYVHGNRILHRDISPDNVLLGPDGIPVLIDFGAAREGAVRATRMLSRVHTVKDGYSPQEFYLGDGSQECSSDLYALAATIRHLVEGTPPPNSTARLSAVAAGRADPCVPLCGRVGGYPRDFLAALDRCLAIFPEDRLQSAEAWLAAIAGSRQGTASRRAAFGPGAVSAALPDAPGRPATPAYAMPEPRPAPRQTQPVSPMTGAADPEIERRISQLVSETCRAIEQDCARRSHPDRGPTPEADRRSHDEERAYWAILNEDPARLRAEAERARREAEADAARHARSAAPSVAQMNASCGAVPPGSHNRRASDHVSAPHRRGSFWAWLFRGRRLEAGSGRSVGRC